jgi:two-component system sensor histidine kinase VanS
VDRPKGLSVRLKLAPSYAAVVVVAGTLLLAVVWLWLLRYVPDRSVFAPGPGPSRGFSPTRSDLLDAFVPKAELAFGALVVFGLVGGWLLAGRVLAPLTRITDAARLAGTGSLSHRVALSGPSDELRELADSFDAMLARLEAHVAVQQRFAANASHELRTPLAITQTVLVVARSDPDRDTDQLLEQLAVVNARAIELTEALLLLSRADQRAFARQPVDLSLLAEEAAESLLPLAEAIGVSLETAGDRAPTAGSHALLLQLTTNLVHNAIVHNLPEHGAVWVTTGIELDRAVLTVENTGAPIDAQVAATLVEPFLRGRGRTRATHAGVGLGLAIAKSIAEAHDGTLSLTSRGGGGLRATVQLPGRP